MKIEILNTHAGDDGKQGVRGSIEDVGGEFKVTGDLGLKSSAESYQRGLAVDVGQIELIDGKPVLTGQLPSPADTLRYMLSHRHLAGKVREVQTA